MRTSEMGKMGRVLGGAVLLSATACAASGGGAATGVQAANAPALPPMSERVAPGGREDFGRSALPVWHPLTAFEERVIGSVLAGATDGWTLLELALVASGDVRSESEAQSLLAPVRRVVADLRAELAHESDPWQKGYLTHRRMHAALLDGVDGGLAGYDADQSRLSEVLRSGRYNCISSALLYQGLLALVGLSPEGVTMATHAFVQVRLDPQRVVEVETTSPTGFDWVHDERFYAQRARSWAEQRGLPTSTFAEYQARQVVSPVELVADAMSVQHTWVGRMKPEDRNRLAELRALVAPSDSQAQANRLRILSDEHRTFEDMDDLSTDLRMFSVVASSLTHIASRFVSDEAMMRRLGWVASYYAESLLRVGDESNAQRWTQQSLVWCNDGCPDHNALRSNAMIVVNRITRDRVEAGDFRGAASLQLRYSKLCADYDGCQSTLDWVYARWAAHHWDVENWEGAIHRLTDALTHARGSEDRERYLGNMSIAYLNWSRQFEREGNWPAAARILARCVEHAAPSQRCTDGLQQVRERHRM